jgi:wyosine [tRNA(Phe)-imidazoG37] synthetase (radical SAM superfamily)
MNGEKTYDINSLMNKIHVSKNKIERAINLLKNQNFIKLRDGFTSFGLDDDIKCCINSREELEVLINRALTSPDEIMQAHSEAMKPNHAAISLDGEPMLYPKMSELIKEFKKRSMTTFVVTNGTLPDKIIELEKFPSQLYVTLAAPNESIYKQVCRPMIKNGWEKINETLSFLDSLSCRSLVRLTAVKNLNIDEKFIKDYIQLIEKANPNFFEIKGFTLQAKALFIKKRLKSDKDLSYYFPDYEFLEDFSHKFEEMSGFPIIYKNKASRDFLFAVNWDKEKGPKLPDVSS